MFIPHFFPKSGETAVMSELLIRGYDVAAPIVDDGDDSELSLIRIQVKSANCLKAPYGFADRCA
jgi:hypothetical protein